MRRSLLAIAFASIAVLVAGIGDATSAADDREREHRGEARGPSVQLGPRPFFLVNDMTDSRLKRELLSCANRKTHFSRSDFSIGHRGAALQFPEHTQDRKSVV